MKTTDHQFKVMISRLQAGELTRNQAAAFYGIGIGTLNVWVSRKKLGGTIPSAGPAGAALERMITDPDKVKDRAEAVARVLSGKISALAVAKEYPGMSHVTIASDVRKARISMGQQVQHRRSPKRKHDSTASDILQCEILERTLRPGT